jgi:hypothetical protein
MELINHIITVIQEASWPARIGYIAYIVISMILLIVKVIPAIYACLTEK